METLLTKARQNKLILNGDQQYFYAINPFEVTNPLGAVIATLQEYTVSNLSGENYKIYKTKEGNWYDIAEGNSTGHNLLLRSLKSAIDLLESGAQKFF